MGHGRGLLMTTGAVGAYFYAVMPSLRRRSKLMNGVYYAHRGLHNRESGIPENSMTAFRHAVQAGYGIELDVQLTKDHIPVVFHDESLKRVCSADGNIADFTYRELQHFSLDGTEEKIPLLADVLKLVAGQVPLLIEIKCTNFKPYICRKTNALLSGYKGAYTIESFNPYVLVWYRIHRPDIIRGQLAMNYQRQEGHYGPERFAARHLLTNFMTRPDFIAYDIRDKEAVSKNLCRKLFRCPSAAWTVRSPEQLMQVKQYYDAFIFEGFRPPITGMPQGRV